MSEDVARPTASFRDATRLPLADCVRALGLTSSERVGDCVMLCPGVSEGVRYRETHSASTVAQDTDAVDGERRHS